MSSVKIDVDLSSWMDENGVESYVYIGESNEPNVTTRMSYEELVAQHIGAHTIYGKIKPQHADEVEEFVIALEAAAKYARQLFEDNLEKS